MATKIGEIAMHSFTHATMILLFLVSTENKNWVKFGH